jgi:hypothetical protein
MTIPGTQTGLKLTDEQLSIITPVAVAEGWALFCHDLDEDLHHIERDDEAGMFDDDESAIVFIQRRASEGSQIHALALAAHNSCPEYAINPSNPALSQNDLDAQHAEEFQQWAEADTLGFLVDPVSAATTRKGRLPLTGEQMQIIDEMAQREGWLLAEHSGGRFNAKFMIDKFDEDPRFGSDDEALAFVRKLAEAGSDYHQLALAAHDKLASEVIDKTVVKVTVILEIDYRLNGIGLPVVHNLLRENLQELIGNEGLVEHLACETTGWSINFK